MTQNIDSFSQVQQRLCPDLCWFVVYESLLMTSEELNTDFDSAQKKPSSFSLFRYTMKSRMDWLLSRHVFFTDISLSLEAWEQSMQFFALNVPESPTFELNAYLNYLEAWCSHEQDWISKRPAPFSACEIVSVR